MRAAALLTVRLPQVDKSSRVKRSLRASEFKEKFEVFNTKLKCVAFALPGAQKRVSAKSHEANRVPPSWRADCTARCLPRAATS